jgi:hypothetical protein
MFENRGLRRMFGPEREEVAGGWRKLHNEKLHDLYDTPNVIRVIKSRRMRLTGHRTLMGEMIRSCNIWLEILKERDHSEDLGVDGRTILE